jgi:hypothetical protein
VKNSGGICQEGQKKSSHKKEKKGQRQRVVSMVSDIIETKRHLLLPSHSSFESRRTMGETIYTSVKVTG